MILYKIIFSPHSFTKEAIISATAAVVIVFRILDFFSKLLYICQNY